jgi:hypothetical protein
VHVLVAPRVSLRQQQHAAAETGHCTNNLSQKPQPRALSRLTTKSMRGFTKKVEESSEF